MSSALSRLHKALNDFEAEWSAEAKPPRRSASGRAVLTNRQIQELRAAFYAHQDVRARLASLISQEALARRYGCSKRNVEHHAQSRGGLGHFAVTGRDR